MSAFPALQPQVTTRMETAVLERVEEHGNLFHV
jgi:hypothetical protein